MKTIIEKSKDFTNLLEELEQSIAYEKCAYHLVKDTSFGQNVYILISLPDKLIIKSGRIDSIKSYINLRKIDISTIFMDKDYLTTTTKDGKT